MVDAQLGIGGGNTLIALVRLSCLGGQGGRILAERVSLVLLVAGEEQGRQQGQKAEAQQAALDAVGKELSGEDIASDALSRALTESGADAVKLSDSLRRLGLSGNDAYDVLAGLRDGGASSPPVAA